jgi:hypothetical protein
MRLRLRRNLKKVKGKAYIGLAAAPPEMLRGRGASERPARVAAEAHPLGGPMPPERADREGGGREKPAGQGLRQGPGKTIPFRPEEARPEGDWTPGSRSSSHGITGSGGAPSASTRRRLA